jgi:hypothetical protein
MAHPTMQLHDRHRLNSVGRVERVYDFVQASWGSRNAAYSLPLRRHEFEVACTDVGMISLLI